MFIDCLFLSLNNKWYPFTGNGIHITVVVFVYPVLPVSVDCPFFIVPSVFSTIYFIIVGLTRTWMKPTIAAVLLLVVVVIVWQLDLQLPVQAVPITTMVVSSNPIHDQVQSMQYYVIEFVSDQRQAGCFLLTLRFRFPSPIKLTVTI